MSKLYVTKKAGPIIDAIRGAGQFAIGAGNLGVGAARLTWQGLKDLTGMAAMAAVGVPLATGLGAGKLASGLSDPTDEELGVREKRILNARIRAMTDENVRKTVARMKANSEGEIQ